MPSVTSSPARFRSTAAAVMALLSALASGAPAGAEITWPRKQYDPSPAAGGAGRNELVLPMPCGGAMVLRRVRTQGAEWLGERTVELGSRDLFDAPLDQQYATQVAGAFDDPDPGLAGGGYYLLGKYEVTELQLRVVGEDCPQRLRGRRPAVKVSWYDALDFTRRYTAWLQQHARDTLPAADGMPGFLRLPTEAEWEFAARGGLAVDGVAFKQMVHPLGEHPLAAYAWYRDSVSPDFKARPVGVLRPNPLGLHDMLGNAAELVFDLYRLSAGGRLRAQTGGFMVKGGHFRTPRKALRTSLRQEHPHFNATTGAETRLDTVGFRVAASAPVLTSMRRLQDIKQAWSKWPRAAAGGDDARCRATAAELTANDRLRHCRVALGELPTTDFPVFTESTPVTELPPWSQLRERLEELPAAEVQQYALAFLNAGDADTALLLFRDAARKGDGRAALAVGAMYDPLLFEAGTRGRTPFSKSNPELARCWYQVAWTLGEVRAWARVRGLMARGAAGGGTEPDLTDTPPGCEQLLQQYGSR